MADKRKKQPIDWSQVVPEAAPARVLARIEAARQALGLSQSAFGSMAGISAQQYTNWKNHGARPSVDQAILLCKAHSLTLEYLYRGDLSGLRHDLHADIAARLFPKRRSFTAPR